MSKGSISKKKKNPTPEKGIRNNEKEAAVHMNTANWI
jgi:hypothetical protein